MLTIFNTQRLLIVIVAIPNYCKNETQSGRFSSNYSAVVGTRMDVHCETGFKSPTGEPNRDVCEPLELYYGQWIRYNTTCYCMSSILTFLDNLKYLKNNRS